MDIAVREQFSFRASALKLSCLLTQSVATAAKVRVNVVAITLAPVAGKARGADNHRPEFDVRMVVGTNDASSTIRGGGPWSNDDQNTQFRDILSALDVAYRITSVVQVVNPEALSPTPGIYRVLLVSLACSGVSVLGSYFGEPILSQTATAQSRQQALSNPRCAPGLATMFFEVVEHELGSACDVLRNIRLDDADAQLCLNRHNARDKCHTLLENKHNFANAIEHGGDAALAATTGPGTTAAHRSTRGDKTKTGMDKTARTKRVTKQRTRSSSSSSSSTTVKQSKSKASTKRTKRDKKAGKPTPRGKRTKRKH
jgi:hypothetical protein